MASYVPPMPAPGAAPKKKSPLVWILLGCAGLILLVAVLAAVAIGFGLYKAKQAGFDPDLIRKNPAVAMVKMAVAANPDAELVSVDENRGIVTVRDKKTGKTVTLNFEDVKKGRISFEGESGEKVTIGSGGPIKLPDWFPAYAGVSPQGTYSLQESTGAAGSFQFITKDSPEQVMQFYDEGLKKAGLTVSTLKQDAGGIVTAQDESQRREASVVVSASGGSTNVTASFKTTKQ